ncbi:hypothetical protein D922_00042 [Enterococcus faecalis 06-MB-DW-09]|nr:hypothetical protein D922_00042 [Enterococcus faecalis 06-MB-DW-09]
MTENIFPEKRKVRKIGIIVRTNAEDDLSLSGDEAQRFLQTYQRYIHGEIVRGVRVGNEFIQFDCICGIEISHIVSEEDNPQKCESIDCLPDYDVNAER